LGQLKVEIKDEPKWMTGKEKAGLTLGIGVMLGTGVVGTGALLGVGGLAIVANPFDMNYNVDDLHEQMV